MKYTFSILLTLFYLVNYCQIKGVVMDEKTKKPLPFVTIGINQSGYGTSTDIDGKFSINKKVSSLQISYVGYETKNINITTQELITITLSEKNITFDEVVIKPEENPALRIIRNVIENKKLNDVEKKDYQCNLYNLFKVNVFFDTSNYKIIPDSIFDENALFEKINNNTYIKYLSSLYHIDSIIRKSHFDLFDNRPLLTLETYVEKKHIAPDRNKELIKASKMSGFKNPSFLALATKIQSFSFYNNYFQIDDNQFLSPISNAGLHNYFYLIEDTLYENFTDTVFIISYRPYKGKNFQGMKGIMQISTNGFAIKNVIAEPADSNALTQITIQQLYELDSFNNWIPKQLLGTLKFNWLSLDPSQSMIGEIKTYIDSFDYHTKIKGREVDNLAFEITPDAHKMDSNEWEALRKVELSSKEKFTVLDQMKDSLPPNMSLDRMLDILRYYRTGKMPMGVFSLDLNRILAFNDFEGFRLGAGIHTNDRLSKLVRVGGYYAYGFKDKQSKYGGDINFMLSKKREIDINYAYSKDVIANGYPIFFESHKNLFDIGDYSTLLINNMDNIEKQELYLSFRSLKHFKFHVFGNIQTRITNSNYLFNQPTSSDNISVSQNTFFISEYGINIRYAHNESFFYDGIDKFSLGTKWPIIYARISKGITTNYGNLDYTKIDIKLTDFIKVGELGITNISINAGTTLGNVPYTLLYNSPGFFKQFNISSDNVFETMRINEFLSNQYGSIFLRHKLKPFFLSKKFKPELELITNVGYGTLSKPENHENIEFKTLDDGYIESGVRLHKLVQVGLSTFGIASYYRYGANSFPEFKNNIVAKFVIGFNFN